MRYQLLEDRPVNVSRREYALYTAQVFLTFTCFAGSAGVLLAALSGRSGHTFAELESIEPRSVQDAQAAGPSTTLVRLEGELLAGTSSSMPDQPDLEVVLGELKLVARTRGGSGEPRSVVLHHWKHDPGRLWLTDGDARVEIAFDPALIPRSPRSRPTERPTRVSDGASARVSRTVAYRFLDREWPLPDDWAGVRSPTAEVVRSFVAAGGRFVMVGRLEDGPNGLGIVGSSADGLRVEAGSMEAIRARQQRLGRIEAWAWLPLLLAGLSLLLRVRRIRGEFEVRSNATRPVAR